MNSRERFRNTMGRKTIDRPPLFEDGIRDEVLHIWRSQGMKRSDRLDKLFSFDYREEIEPDLEPIPIPGYWPKTMRGLKNMAGHMDADDPSRLPEDWSDKVKTWKNRDYPLILRIHRGYFLTLGVHGWRRFSEAIQLLVDDPQLVSAWMSLCGEFSAKLAEKILQQVEVDAVLFSEPIGGNHGPLISPKMYASFVLNSYTPVMDVIRRYGIETIIYRTYANTRVLLGQVFNAGFNCLWACESNPEAMDYLERREEFGPELRLIGGIDSDSLRQGQEEIRRAVTATVPILLEKGGYIPLADGRVREDVSYKNYLYYRKLLETVTTGSNFTIN